MSGSMTAQEQPSQPAMVSQDHGLQKTIFATPRAIERTRAGLTNPKARARFERMITEGKILAVHEVSCP